MTDQTNTPVMTPEMTLTVEEALNSVKISLADLCAKGTSFFAHKNYTDAMDYFARAAELQAELNGEMDPTNAEVLFLYGRSLFKVGQSKSDVLGGKAGGEKKKPKGSAKDETRDDTTATEHSYELDTIVEETAAPIAGNKDSGTNKEEEDGPKKPLFQFTGDENFEDSDEEEAPGGGEGEEEEEEDDLAAAFDVLDLARVLFTKKLEQPEESEGKGKAAGDSPMATHIKERLADTHDLLAEISLENERFPNAVSDFKSALQYKKDLFPKESEIIAEAHYKLSLALEFASITTTQDANTDDAAPNEETHVDEAMREEAATELEAAIESTKLKLQSKETELASTLSSDDNDITIQQISEVKEIIADMEQRLLDLRAPPIDVNAAINGQTGEADFIKPLGGVLGATLGQSPAEAQALIDEAKKTAKDLTGLVRRKDKAAVPEKAEGSTNGASETNGAASNGKRKAEDLEEGDEETSKKAKIETASEIEA